MFKSGGTPPRASATGSLRGRPEKPFYNHAQASRSTTDLPSTIVYGSSYGGISLSPMVMASPRSSQHSQHSQRTLWARRGSLEGLSSTIEPGQRAAFEPPILRPSDALQTTERMRRFLLHNFNCLRQSTPALTQQRTALLYRLRVQAKLYPLKIDIAPVQNHAHSNIHIIQTALQSSYPLNPYLRSDTSRWYKYQPTANLFAGLLSARRAFPATSDDCDWPFGQREFTGGRYLHLQMCEEWLTLSCIGRECR
ncbi:uncharacterized protein M421DRAFT_133050 [Didymella exigua CBS 183.55]|uniref:Uncharacterized protein n=1 Tax=Didymella exigua CBS 183.55 TaxID=1150837 RepID=A0A6A5RPB7_9PLEO|nr:uncharacterized protein M421DRAFT_133050 [Didymella exigua CBS 183.55]KAF1929170.1 hypothetical protein M421DRAFT_133050 [Didymella exigua CBS 183.55]